MAELTVFVVAPSGAPLTSPGDLPEIQIRRVDTQAIVQAFTAMTEIGDGMYSFTFAPSATLEYTFTVDADPSTTGQAIPRYFGGSISGPADDALLSDVPDILTDTSTMEPIVSTNLDTTVSSRAAPGDAMDLVAGAVDAAAIATDAIDADAIAADAIGSSELATSAVNEIRDAILSDSTPFPGANIDVAISSRSDFDETTDPVELLDTGGAAGTSASELVDDIWDEAIAGHSGAGSAGLELQNKAEPGDAMDLVAGAVDAAAVATDAIDADALATDAVNEIRDAILSDSTPFAGANIDAAISTRATQASVDVIDGIVDILREALIAGEFTAAAGSSTTEIRTNAAQANNFFDDMVVVVVNSAGTAARNITSYANTNGAFTVDALPFTPAASDPVYVLNQSASAAISTSGIADAVWDEDIVAAHGTSDTAGLLLRALGALISQRTNNANLNALLGVADTAGTDLPEQVDTELTATHGAGAWTTGAGGDWTSGEREQIRFRLAMDGTQTDPTTNTGTIEDILADTSTMEPIVSTNLDTTVSSRSDFDETTDPVELLDAGGAAGTSAAELVDDIWDEAVAGHSGAGSTGLELQNKAEPGDAMDLVTDAVDAAALATDAVDEIVDGVWAEALPGANPAGSAGERLASTDDTVGANLDVAVSTRATQVSVDTIDTNVDTIVAKLPAGNIADETGEIQVGVTYDNSTSMIDVNLWLEQDVGQVTGTLSAGTIRLYSSAGAALTSALVAASPDAQGVFNITFADPGFAIGENATYMTLAITDSGPPSRTITGVVGVTFSRLS